MNRFCIPLLLYSHVPCNHWSFKYQSQNTGTTENNVLLWSSKIVARFIYYSFLPRKKSYVSYVWEHCRFWWLNSSAIYLLDLRSLKAVLYGWHRWNGVTSVSFTTYVAIKQTRRHLSEDLNLHQYLSGSLKFGSVCFLSFKLFRVENLQPLLSSKLIQWYKSCSFGYLAGKLL